MKKKFLFAITLLVVVVGYLFGAAPTDGTADSYFYWKVDTAIDKDGAFDTLAAADSSTIVSNFSPLKGFEYVLVRDAFTGTGADSTSLQVIVETKNTAGAILRRAVIDTFAASAAEDVVIPFGATLFGNKFDIKLVGFGADGGQLILNKLYLYRRTNLGWRKTDKIPRR